VTLHFYLARKFLWRFVLVLAVFLILTIMNESRGMLIRYSGFGVGFVEALGLGLIRAPAPVYEILPLIAVIASLALFIGLARSNELVIARAAGRSAFRTLTAPLAVAFFLGILAVSVFNPIVAATQKQFLRDIEKYQNGGISTFSVGPEGLWLRQGSDAKQTVIHARRANAGATRLFDVAFFEFSSQGQPLRRYQSAFADLSSGAWELHDGKVWNIDQPEANPEQSAREFTQLSLASDMTSAEILDSFGDPKLVSFWDMRSFVARLEKSGFSANTHRVFFQMELALPLTMMAMVLIGAGFTMRHTRFGRTGTMVLMSMISAFGFFALRKFAQILGANGDIPIVAAAWAPPIVAGMLAVSLLLHLEDG